METGPLDAKAQPDRFSTCDEVRAALSFLPDSFVEPANDRVWEVPSDQGGHVLIEMEEEEVMSLYENLDTAVN